MAMKNLAAACVVAVAVASLCRPAAAADPLPRATAESVGMSTARLERIDAHMNAEVAAGRIPGGVVGVARKGKLVYLKAFGYADQAAGVPMATDSIFSIASMTKPLVCVGTLMLYEDGVLMLGDPVAKWLPELGQMKVAKDHGDVAPGTPMEMVPLRRPVTVQDLMRHTAGLLYGNRGNTELHKLYPSTASQMSAEEFVAKIASLPLAYQPGTVFDYSLSLDVLGVLVERAAGKPMDAYLRERIFVPLKMEDTGFLIPPEKWPRYARPFPADKAAMVDSTKPLKMNCGGSCAYSTAGDYLRFAQMLLDRGSLDGARILAPKTVQFMTSDQLPPGVDNRMVAVEPYREGYGFGLGVAVRRQDGVAATIGTAGDYFWNGAYGTGFWVDPKEELVGVMMTTIPGNFRERLDLRQAISALVYQAIER
jgi:CubicO group peptidase (beta-lactamase class C family)